MKSLAGHLLVASPELRDGNFFRSVVLMIQHDDEGAFGLVLNRPTRNTVGDVWEMVADFPVDNDEPISIGGPVQGPLMALHTEAVYGENEVLPGLYMTTDKDHLDYLVRNDHLAYRIFSGYSGWAAGQLEDEMEVGGWLISPARAEQVFCDAEDLWKDVSREIGIDILSQGVARRLIPLDPTVN